MMATHDQLMKMHDKAYNHGYSTRLKAADDLLFAWVTQWDDSYLDQSELGYRGEFDILRKAIRQILTDLTINTVQVDFEPVDDSAEKAAEIMDGSYRASMRNNRSQEAKKNANQESVVCGVGAWELRNEYVSDDPDDDRQKVVRVPIYEANNTVYWDPNAKLLDKSDAKYCSVLTSYTQEGYKELCDEFGFDFDGEGASFKQPESSYVFPWVSETNYVYVSRFFTRKKTKTKHYIYQDMFGSELKLTNDEVESREDELVDGGYNLLTTKEVTRWEVTRYIVSGDGIIDEQVIPGEHIPVVPQYGERQIVEGEEHYEGVTRLAKDPQRLRNFQLSYLADIVSTSPREKPIFTQDQIGGFEDLYEQTGADNRLPYLLQNGTDANGNPLPVGPVGYIKAPEVPPAMLQSIAETRAAVDDVAGAQLPKDITDVDLSGKAISALNKRLDMQSYTYQDNHKFALRRDGEIYASMMSEIVDIEQSIPVEKIDGTRSSEVVNAESVEFTSDGLEKVVNNKIGGVKFEVYADIGPSFSSVKEQSKEEIKGILNSGNLDPETHKMLLNEYLTMIDGSSFEDIRNYGRKQLILSGAKKPETPDEQQMVAQAQASQQGQPNPALIMAQAEVMKAQADMLAQQNKQSELQMKALKLRQDGYQIQVDEKKTEAEIANTNADTINKLANAQKTAGQTVGQQLDNLEKVTPKVTIGVISE